MRRIPAKSWMLAVASAILQILIFPEPSLIFLGWIALAPLFVAVIGPRLDGVQLIDASGRNLSTTTPGQGFWLGYACGILWYLGTCYWVFHVMHSYGGLDEATSVGLLVLFSLYLGLYHGLFGAVLAWIARATSKRRALVAAPFLWVAVELARARITGFPWDLLGTTQIGNVPLSRIATITGVYGISFEIALVNAAFAAAYFVPATKRASLVAMSIAAAVVLQAGVLVHPAGLPTTHTARLVQQNVPILQGWSPEYYEQTLRELAEASLPSDSAKVDLIIWPESPAPFFLNDARFIGTVEGVAQRAHAYVIAGSVGVKNVQAARGERPYKLLNSAVLISPAGVMEARYDKLHLVPFGEYVPFQSLLVFAQKLTKETGDFVSGTERKVFDAGGQRIGTFICYESIFPDEVREFARNGAQVFVNISNDGWFGETGAPEQHLNMARMRAVENGRWLLRSTNTGITASIDPYGRVVARAPRNTRVTLEVPYALETGTTFYTRHGDWFAYLCAIITLAALFMRFRIHSRRVR